jgi:hypothetical protein
VKRANPKFKESPWWKHWRILITFFRDSSREVVQWMKIWNKWPHFPREIKLGNSKMDENSTKWTNHGRLHHGWKYKVLITIPRDIQRNCMIRWKYVKMKAFKTVAHGQKYREVGAHFLEDHNWETWPNFPYSPSNGWSKESCSNWP